MIRLRPRLSISAAAALASFLLLPSAWPLTGRLLAAWDIAALLYFGLAWVMMAGSSLDTMRQGAQQEDERAVVILALTALAAVASLWSRSTRWQPVRARLPPSSRAWHIVGGVRA